MPPQLFHPAHRPFYSLKILKKSRWGQVGWLCPDHDALSSDGGGDHHTDGGRSDGGVRRRWWVVLVVMVMVGVREMERGDYIFVYI